MSDKGVFRIIIAISVFVFLVVVVLNQKLLPKPDFIPHFVLFLPLLNACLNGTCTILLLTSFYFIKRKNITVHKRLNITAFVLSSLLKRGKDIADITKDQLFLPKTTQGFIEGNII